MLNVFLATQLDRIHIGNIKHHVNLPRYRRSETNPSKMIEQEHIHPNHPRIREKLVINDSLMHIDVSIFDSFFSTSFICQLKPVFLI